MWRSVEEMAMRSDGPAARAGRPAGIIEATAIYTDYRKALFTTVYNLLGTVTDTEDVLQETWLSWVMTPRERVANPRAYLLRIAVNDALARLRRQRRDRECYIGPWLPEPVVTQSDGSADGVLTAESVSLALLVVLETLTPLERTVFVLREAFGYEHTEIAMILRRSPAAVRQIAQRAREHVQARRPGFTPDPQMHQAATERFISAAIGGDIDTLMQVLSPGAQLWTDGGGKLRALRHVLEGSEKIAHMLASRLCYHRASLTPHYVEINGAPGALVLADGVVYAAVVLDLDADDGRVTTIYAVVNPDKLTQIRQQFKLAMRPAG
jgi:RNA polymerase sigma factor (sigma-70 family)